MRACLLLIAFLTTINSLSAHTNVTEAWRAAFEIAPFPQSLSSALDRAGNLLWVQRYEGPLVEGCNQSYPGALALDHKANVYVAGRNRISPTETEWITFKYDSDGHLLWTARASSPGFQYVHSVNAGPDGSLYVAGSEWYPDGSWRAVVIKYDQPNPPCDAIAELSQRVEQLRSEHTRKGLLVHLRKACEFLNAGHKAAAVHHLELFRSKVLVDDSLANLSVRQELARAAQEIIDAINAATPGSRK